MTLRLGSCERALMRLSVKPSLRYSLLGSVVALTKGRTAMEVTFWVSDFPRVMYTVRAAAASSTMAAIAPISFLSELAGGGTVIEDEEMAAGAAMLLTADELEDRPESWSRLRRARSVRRSAAL